MNRVEIANMLFNAILSLVSIYIAYRVYKLNKKDHLPQLAVHVNQKRVGRFFDMSVNKETLDFDFEQDGFPVEEESHEHLLWEMIVYNNSEIVATNIEIKYHIVIKKMDFSYGIDEADIVDPHLVDFAVIDKHFSCEYLPPRGKVKVKVLYLTGKFPASDLYIDTFKCDKCKYITKKVKVSTYEHLGFEYIEDSLHMRRLYGSGRTRERKDNDVNL